MIDDALHQTDVEEFAEFIVKHRFSRVGGTIFQYAIRNANSSSERRLIAFILKDSRHNINIDYLFQPDEDGNTIFHFVINDEVLKLLLSVVKYEHQEQFVPHLNNKQQTILHHLASRESLISIFLQFCKVKPLPIEYLMRPDNRGNTPLHLNRNENLLKYLMTNHLALLQHVLIHRNCLGQNVLHAAAADMSLHVKGTADELVWQLCVLVDLKDLTHGDDEGMSVVDYLMDYVEIDRSSQSDITEILHLLPIPSVAAAIIGKLPYCKRPQIMCKVNSKEQTVLHTAVMDTNNQGVSLFLGEQVFWPLIDLMLRPDIDGNTPLHLSIIHAKNGDLITELLIRIDKNKLRDLLLCKNLKARNVFHLAAMCNQSGWHDYLWELTDYVDGNVFTESDIVGNNVIDYLMVTQQINNLGHVLMNCLAPSTRQKCLQEKRNHAGLRCTDMVSIHSDSHRGFILRLFEIVCRTQSSTPMLLFDRFRVRIPVLSDLRHHIQKQMQSLVNYALHAFSLTDQSAPALRTALSSQEVKCLLLRKLI